MVDVAFKPPPNTGGKFFFGKGQMLSFNFNLIRRAVGTDGSRMDPWAICVGARSM